MEEMIKSPHSREFLREFLEGEAEQWIGSSKPQEKERLLEMRVRYLLKISEQ